MNNKYLMFAVKVIGEVANALEDGKITPAELQEFILLLITEVPKLIKKD